MIFFILSGHFFHVMMECLPKHSAAVFSFQSYYLYGLQLPAGLMLISLQRIGCVKLILW